jgi:hypothetical protein
LGAHAPIAPPPGSTAPGEGENMKAEKWERE